MVNSVLEIINLHVNFKVYGGILKVVNGLDLLVGRKEKVGLIGEAGSGKTTTMKATLRILAENALVPQGEILLDGRDVLKLNRKDLQTVRRKNISMIFQDPTAALNPVFKIDKQLSDIIKYNRIAMGKNPSKSEIRADSIEILKQVSLPDPARILDNYPFQLSGGMKQRVCIAMALVAANELLIADEPGTSLDVTIEDQILKLLREVVEEKGISIILISHALGALKGLVDRIYVMYGGSIVEMAQTEELFSNPMHPYTCGLIKAIPKITGGGIPQGISGGMVSYLNPVKGCRFFPRCKLAESSCEDNKPELFEVSEGHQIACFKCGRN